jgi:hypothetical protein
MYRIEPTAFATQLPREAEKSPNPLPIVLGRSPELLGQQNAVHARNGTPKATCKNRCL